MSLMQNGMLNYMNWLKHLATTTLEFFCIGIWQIEKNPAAFMMLDVLALQFDTDWKNPQR